MAVVSPYATGGGGVLLEYLYGAVLLSHLLAGNPIVELGQDATPISVQFQVGSEAVDDLLVSGSTPGGERRAWIDVRRRVALVASDTSSVRLLAAYVRMVATHWEDIEAGRGWLCLAVADANAAIRQLNELTNLARASSNEAGFRAAAGNASNGVKSRLSHVDALIASAGAETDGITDGILTWRVLNSLRVRVLELEGEDAADRLAAIRTLGHLTVDDTPAAGDALFGRLVELSGRYGSQGAEVTMDRLRRDLGPLGMSIGGANPQIASVRPTPGTPAVYYAGLLADVARGEDRLGVSAEVDTICNVIMARDVAPPLSIGLFGNWGTGKSFFMSLMRDRIAHLAKISEQLHLEGTEAELCVEVCQIEFNAWHYIDSNLWASLASRIFDQLAAAYDEPGFNQVMSDLPSMRAISGQLRDQRRQLQDRVEKLEAEIAEAQPVGIKNLTLAGISKARDEFSNGIPDSVGDLLEKAGVSKDKIKELDEGLPRINSASSLSLFLLRRGRWTVRLALLVALLVVVVGPSLAAGLLHPYVGSAAAWVSGWVGSLAAATLVAGPALNRASNVLQVVADLAKNVDEDRQKSAIAQQEGLRKRIADIQGEIDDLDARIQAVADANSLQAFALKRHGDDDYRREEGTLAVFRRDLEELSRKLTPPPAGGPVPEASGPDLERIILYIDDLDRCPPARVVEVLQAIHLLLAFPLFVVVVGADPRWLLKSLHTHYRSILGSAEWNDGTDDPAADGHWAATPQNYLEKIFQIPFCLRPMSSDGYSSLVAADIGQLTASDASPAPADSGEVPLGVAPTHPETRSAIASTVPPAAQTATKQVSPLLVRTYPGDAVVKAVAFTPVAAPSQSVLTSLHVNGQVIRRDARKTGDAVLTEGALESPWFPDHLTDAGAVVVTEVRVGTDPARSIARARIFDGTTRQELSAIDFKPVTDGLQSAAATKVSRLLLSRTGQTVAAIWDEGVSKPGGYWMASTATGTALDAKERKEGEPRIIALDAVERKEGEPRIIADSWHVARRANALDWITDKASVPLEADVDCWFVTDTDQHRLLAVDPTGKMRMWTIGPTPGEVRLPDALAEGNCPAVVVCLGPGRLLAAATGASTRIWDLDAGRLHAEVEASAAVTALALSADDKRIAIGLQDGTVQCWLIAEPSQDDELATGVMRLTKREAASILLMGGLIKTPRSARRLINIYRLLRAGLTADDLDRLRSEDHGPVILLLATLIGFPQQSADLLKRLMDHSSQAPAKLADFIESRERTAAGSVQQPNSATPDRFEESVTRILANGEVSDDSSVYRYWAPRVARFSFRTMDLL